MAIPRDDRILGVQWMQALALGLGLALMAALAGCGGGAGISPGSGAVLPGSALAETEHVSPTGAYQTSIKIAVPPAPGAPQITLVYDSQANLTLAGTGWDLLTGYPMSIMRDVRFGTPQWTRSSAWLWGATPLVPANGPPCNLVVDATTQARTLTGDCTYLFRMAPETLARVAIDLATGSEMANVRLPNGTTLEYQPIRYDGTAYPPAPAGAETSVLGFRLASVSDRNGFRTCFYYRAPGGRAAGAAADSLPDPDGHWGEPTLLEKIGYGPTPIAGDCTSNAYLTTHRIEFHYSDLSPRFFRTWTMKFGAPVSFNSLLDGIDVYAMGSPDPQDQYSLEFDGDDSETRRPLLTKISQTVPTNDPVNKTSTRVVRMFAYGKRSPQFGSSSLVELGAVGTFPPSLSGTISRPIRHQNPLNDAFGLFQFGNDQVTDASPWVHATTEQWMFADINGDGLPDVQWGVEGGTSMTWSTFEGSTPATPRPPQQKVLINEGIVGSRLGTTTVDLDSHANSSDARSMESLYASVPDKPAEAGFTPWFWGEGRGETRTGMPVSVSAPEIARVVKGCTPLELQQGTDSRVWPAYPDGTFGGSQGSIGEPLAAANPFPPGGNKYVGNPAIEAAIGIFNGYQPVYAVSSTLSAWMDLDGDGAPEFIATPGWIERFSIVDDCKSVGSFLSLKTPDSWGARYPGPASTGGMIDTDWHIGSFPTDSMEIKLQRMPGPPGPVGMPLTYDVSTGSADGFGFTLPIGSMISVGVQSLACQCWYAIAAAAPGLTAETFTPRVSSGFALSIPAPSGNGFLQSLGSAASQGGGYDFVSSLVRINYDFTVLAATSRNRSETRGQLIDLNGDGLPDYLLYNSGMHPDASDPLFGMPPGGLVAFFNSPTGFAGPTLINSGFDYPTLTDAAGLPMTLQAILTQLQADFRDATDADSGLVWPPLLGNPPDNLNQRDQMFALSGLGLLVGEPATLPDAADNFCKTRGVLPITGIESCAFYSDRLLRIASLASDAVTVAAPFFAATTDAILAERRRLSQISTMADLLRVQGVALHSPGAIVVASAIGPMDTATAIADTLTETLGLFVQSVRQLAHSSRINAVSRGFSHLDAATWEQYSNGIAAQTRGFVDLNGDGLPDYVVTDDRQSLCQTGQWEVFWGTGSSSLAARRAFDPMPSCVPVPALPTNLSVMDGVPFNTLPLTMDHVHRSPQQGDITKPNRADTVVDSLMILADVNGDGRLDILLAIDADHPWKRYSGEAIQVSTDTAEEARLKRIRTWHVFLNNGFGFETTSFDISTPSNTIPNVVAVISSPTSGLDENLDVPYPTIRTTMSFDDQSVGGRSRDRTDTTAGLMDLDGDSTLDAVRRVRINDADPTKPQKEGLLVWRRPNIGGPQDLMIEERDPANGHRFLIDYKPAVNFQWRDARPDGTPPVLGHQRITGVARNLVGSVRTERLLGWGEQRTGRSYDYKLPHFDLATRTPAGFGLVSTSSINGSGGQTIDASVATSERSAQRPNAVPEVTQSRAYVRGSGAPVSETLTSFVESDPTATAVGLGGLKSTFSVPARVLKVEYPSDVKTGPILDIGFDGREPWRDRVTGRAPIAPSLDCPEFNSLLAAAPVVTEIRPDGALTAVATGGAARFSAGALPVQCSTPTGTGVLVPLPFVLQYASPHPRDAMGTPVPQGAVTIEMWLRPDAGAGDQVAVEQTGAYRLVLLDQNGTYRWQLQLNGTDCAVQGSTCITSSPQSDSTKARWHHVVASFGPGGGGLFEDGRALPITIAKDGQNVANPATVQIPAVTPGGNFIVACGTTAACFAGEVGELRVYAARWTTPPRVTDTETLYNITTGCTFDEPAASPCGYDFGQPRVALDRNDLATFDDDVAAEFEYAAPDSIGAPTGAAPVYGLVSVESRRELAPDDGLGAYLSYTERRYDGLPLGRATVGNQTQLAQFDGLAQSGKPTQLNVRTNVEFSDPLCPGLVTRITDPLGNPTETRWDSTCAFTTSGTNTLGHKSQTTYYGVNYGLGGAVPTRSGQYGSFALRGHYGQIAEQIDANGATTLSTYDEWGRPAAVWSPLDRTDRPGLRLEYADATCRRTTGANSDCYVFGDPLQLLRAPSRITTFVWDDARRRCVDNGGNITPCEYGSEFADEIATGGYRISQAFGDGQVHAQGVNQGRPAWTVSGIVDYDPLGRAVRVYKTQFLPSACLGGAAGWCDDSLTTGAPLHNGVAAIQLAYDERGRLLRTYGPSWPSCGGADPSTPGSAPGQLVCDSPPRTPTVNDVTKFEYPAPGDTRMLDGNNVPTLVHRDVRGNVTLLQQYARPPSGGAAAVPQPYSAVSSAFDRLGRHTSTRDQNNNVSLAGYDALSRVRSTSDPDRGLTTLEYDLRSQLTDLTVASGERTHHEYDPIGRLVQTDYLRPRSVPAPGGGRGSGDGPPPDWDKFLCPNTEILMDPTWFIPSSGPVENPELAPIPLSAGTLRGGEAEVVMPFDVVLRTTSLTKPGGSADAPLDFVRGRYSFSEGTPVFIRTDGRLSIGARAASSPGMPVSMAATAQGTEPAPTAQGVLDVFPSELVLKEGGLRSGVIGEKGRRRFIVEWEGSLAGRENAPALARVVFTEDASTLRYEYPRVPPAVEVKPGIRLADGGSTFERGPGDASPLLVGSGTAFSFGELEGMKGVRLICSRPPQKILEIPFAGADVKDAATVRLDYRVFAPCEGGPEQCVGSLTVAYRALDGIERRPQDLTIARYRIRDPRRSGRLDDEPMDTLEIALPDDIRGKDFALTLSPQAGVKAGGQSWIFDVIWGGRTQTVYDPEERVHRTYDSSEPPYYIDTRASGAQFETKPVLDITFDVPGRITDRSPSQAQFAPAACGPGYLTEDSIAGASGRALRLGPGATCTGSVTRPAATTQLTGEMWVRSSRVTIAQPVLSVGPATLSLDADQHLLCAVGAGQVTSAVSLPSDAWSHIAFSSDGATLRCFVNGVLQGQAPGALNIPPTFTVTLGGGQAVLDVDELRLIGAGRSEGEILADALRPLGVGPPRGNLLYVDFAHPFSASFASCPGPGRCAYQRDWSKARNDALLIDGTIVPGVLGMVFDTRAARPIAPGANLPPPTGQVRVEHSDTLQLWESVTAELWLKTTASQTGAARLVGKWASETSPGWRLQMTPSGRLRWEVVTRPAQGSGQIRRSVFITYETVNDLAWHHVAATFDGQHLRVFKDGLPMHRWCGSGPREGAQPDGPNDSENCATPPPPTRTCPPVDTLVTDLPIPAGQKTHPVLGDIECIRGVIDNTQPVLAADDDDGNALDGFLDELRLSNYAKRDFEVAASARLASAFSQTLGRETILRNRFIWLDGKLVGPLSNSEPYDLAYQPARELSAFDLQGRRVSGVKHVVGQLSDGDYFLRREARDSLGGRGSLEYPHGEVLVSGFDPDGTLRSLFGYGPQIGSSPAQSQGYVTGATSAITGQPATLAYGNGVTTAWSYEDGPVPVPMFSLPSGAFGSDSLKRVVVTGPGSAKLSERAYDQWDAVGNLIHVHDGPYDATYSYDDLSRIRSATLAAPQNPVPALYFDYDVLGNLTLVDGKDAAGALREGDGAKQAYGRSRFLPACPAGSNALPHALSERTVLPHPPLAGGTPTETRDALCYDAAGKMLWSRDSLQLGDRTYIYFARGKPRSVSAANGRSHFLYDGNGVRVAKREDGRDSQIILDSIYREISPGLIGLSLSTPVMPRFEAMYPSRGELIARRVLSSASAGAPLTTSPDALNWLNKDHLGGTYFLTSLQGQEVGSSRAYYRPYGGFLDGAHPPQTESSGQRQFTSKELDASGVYDVGARLYDPRTGRFTQADGATTLPDAQSNPFAYARNNPVLYVDPDGKDAIRVFDVKNGKITIVIPVHFVGDGATKDMIAATVKQAADLDLDWRDTPGAVPVTFVIVPTDTPINGVLNTVDFSPFTPAQKVLARGGLGYAVGIGGHRAYVDTGRSRTTESLAGTGTHEILHLVGLKDRYVSHWYNSQIEYTKEYPKANIMTSSESGMDPAGEFHGRKNVRTEQLNEALQNPTSPLYITDESGVPTSYFSPYRPLEWPGLQPRPVEVAPKAPASPVTGSMTLGESEMTVKYTPPAKPAGRKDAAPAGRRYDWDVPDHGRGAK